MCKRVYIILNLFVYLLCFLLPANLFATSNDFESLTSHGMTLRQINKGESKIKVKYIIKKVDFRPDSLYVGSEWCEIDGFGQTSTLGAPSLPVRIDRFELPFGCDSAEVRILNSNYVYFDREITPGRQIFAPRASICLDKNDVPSIKISQITGQDGIVAVSNVETCHGKVFVNVRVQPGQYDSDTKKVVVFNEFEYIVLPLSTGKKYIERDSDNIVMRKNSFASLINELKKYPVEGDAAYIPDYDALYCDLYNSYLIVTCDDYYGAALDFAQFKKELGYNTMISSRISWTETQARDTIQSYYYKYKDLGHVLILGSWKDIPGRIETSSINNESYSIPTDYYFGCISSNDTGQNIYVGRIPAKNVDEAYCIVDKIKQYFFFPPQSNSYYDNGVHVADFGDSSYDWEGYVKNSEECRDIVMKYGKSVRRSYFANHSADPSFFVDYSNNNRVIPIPEELKKPNFMWNADMCNIADSINKGCFYVLYRGHGDTTQWWRPKFDISDFPLLNNTPTVFISPTCLTGKYSMPNNDCFAEGLLKYKNGGAVAVFAAGVPTDRMFNENFAKDILKMTLKNSLNPTNYPEETLDSTLGKMLVNGFTTIQSMDYAFMSFHQKAYQIFGDPSMMMWTKYPKEYSSSEVWHIKNGNREAGYYDEVIINVENEGCYVAIYEYETDESYLIYGTRMSFPYFNSQKYKMVIYGVNRIPLVVNEMPYDPSYHPDSHLGSLRITPNPANSFCEIEYKFNKVLLNTASAVIKLTSFSTGDVVKEFIVKDSCGIIQVDVSALPTGYYIVNIYGCMGTSMGVGDTPIVSAKLIVDHYK